MSQIAFVRIFPLAIPLHKAFSHAAHVRRMADPVVVQVELADHTVGYGEALARDYVTGETAETVVANIRGMMPEVLLRFRPRLFAEALEMIEQLPVIDRNGRGMPAARAAVELALLDAYSRHFRRPLGEAVGWLGLAGLGPPGSVEAVRFSGVLSGDDLGRLRSSVRKMRWFGLHDFKLKVGFADDVERIRTVAGYLGRSLGRSTTLRLDANGGWTLERAVEVLRAVQDLPIRCVEQPLPREQDGQLPELKNATPFALMADESLVTIGDGQRLIDEHAVDIFNIRVSKNGGLLSALKLAHLAMKNNVDYQLGCMVGETGILSAAGRRFLENMPRVLFAEGSYGRFLLTGDIVDRPVQFGWGGKGRPLEGLGWGIEVQPERLERYAVVKMIEIPL
ncbi:MAG: dipeptide epimerase [Phycisphaerales bacterium]|nr:dipeptide epimerase [Phycisphaerales bacterium]